MSLKQFAEKESDAHLLLARHVIASHADGKNLVLSPLSIHVILAMTAAGSSGPTRAQLLSYLNSDLVEQLNSLFSQITSTVLCDGSPLGGPVLSTNNGLWVDRSLTLQPAFRNIVHNSYKAAAENVDFKNQFEEARKQVNAWANKETKGLIKEILPPNSVSEETKLILANAVYFKGEWDQVFDASQTRDLDFQLLNGSPIRVPFMSNWCMQCVRAFNGFKVLKLPYKQGGDNRRFSMYIYLPDAQDGLPALIERMCSEPGFINRHLPQNMEILDAFRIPKFKIGFEFEASKVMKELGVVHPFRGGLTEMVDGIEDDEGLFVNKILHKAFIEMNEEGTEAASITVEFFEEESCMLSEDDEPRLEFVADHPFLFVIREDTSGVILFIGQLLNPIGD